MYYAENGELVSISYADWLRTCIDLQNAFVIVPKEEITDEDERQELLIEFGDLLDATYPERKEVRYFPVVKYLGHYLYSNEVGIAMRDLNADYVLTYFDIKDLLEKLSNPEAYEIIDAFRYEEIAKSKSLCLLSLPCGIPLRPKTIF